MKVNYKIVVTSLFLLSSFILGGCNTASGFGKDIQVGGEAIQQAAAEDNPSSNKKANTTKTTKTTKTTNATSSSTSSSNANGSNANMAKTSSSGY